MKAQGAVEYIIILSLIIIISLIIAGNLGMLRLPSFAIASRGKMSEINQLLNEVAVRYSLSSSGLLQASVIILSSDDIRTVNLTFKKGTDKCNVVIRGTNYKHWVSASNTCEFLTGESGNQYSFNCTVSYVSPDGLTIKRKGLCSGVYEEVNSTTRFWVTESESDFNSGVYFNTTYGSVHLITGYATGEYVSRIYDAGESVNWTGISWENDYYGKEWESDSHTVLLRHLNDGCEGVLNSAHCFSNSYIDLGNSPSVDFSTGDFSISLWFKANNISGTQSLIDKGTGSYVDGYGLALMSDGRLNFITDGNDNSGAKYYLYSNAVILPDKWYHVVIERENGIKRIFINSSLQANTQTDSRELSNPSRHLLLGKADVDSNQFFNGTIDEVIVFNKALSESEVENLYERGILRLTPQVRSCSNPSCSGGRWGTFPVNPNRFFEYKFVFSTNDSSLSPMLEKVVVSYNLG